MPGGFPHRGEVWGVDFPDDPKSRPALIVSPDARNQYSNSVLAVPITTNLRPAPTHVGRCPPGRAAWLSTRWPAARTSVTSTSRGCDADPFTGTIGAALMREIERCLFRAFGIGA